MYITVLLSIFSIFIVSQAVSVRISERILKSFIGFAFLLLLLVIFSFSTGYTDQENYENLFNIIRSSGEGYFGSQPGLVYLYRFCIYLGLDFESSLIIIFCFGFLFIQSVVSRFSVNSLFVYALYVIYPFFLDVVQVKQFVCMSLVVFALQFTFKRNGFLKYCFFVIVAASFHYVAIFFLPFIFLSRFSVNKLILICGVFVFLFSFLVQTGLYEFLIFSETIYFRVKHYLENAPGYGFVIQIFIQMLILFAILFFRYKLVVAGKDNDFIRAVAYANIYLVILFPFYMINGNFERVFRVMYIPNYIVLANFLALYFPSRKLLLSITSVIFMSALSFWYFYGILDITVFPILDNNWFIDIFSY